MSDRPPDLFAERMTADGQDLRRVELTALQLNLGKKCNLACHHCHVEAGPKRIEIMSWQTMKKILAWIDEYRPRMPLTAVDLTGGAPEMNPHFRRLVEELGARGLHVLDRCNLAILLEEDHDDLVDFLAENRVEIVASLPCYLEDNVDRQRGRGVFTRSLEALRRLNALGYGRGDTGLRLDLVYNPMGNALPPDQPRLEADYKRELRSRFGIVFDALWTLTNMPIRRFATQLYRDGMYETYVEKLVAAHTPANVERVMCRAQVSVGWLGSVYDCDFHQMLQMPLEPGSYGPGSEEHEVEQESRKLWQFAPEELVGRGIRTAVHCFGCTAGAGSSCGGALS